MTNTAFSTNPKRGKRNIGLAYLAGWQASRPFLSRERRDRSILILGSVPRFRDTLRLIPFIFFAHT